MIDHMTPKLRREGYDPKPSGRLLWWICGIALVLFISVMLYEEARGDAILTLSDPLCPSGVRVWQRHDKRDWYGIIIERKWKMKCDPSPLVIREKLTASR